MDNLNSAEFASPVLVALKEACGRAGGTCTANFYQACAGQATGVLRRLQKNAQLQQMGRVSPMDETECLQELRHAQWLLATLRTALLDKGFRVDQLPHPPAEPDLSMLDSWESCCEAYLDFCKNRQKFGASANNRGVLFEALNSFVKKLRKENFAIMEEAAPKTALDLGPITHFLEDKLGVKSLAVSNGGSTLRSDTPKDLDPKSVVFAVQSGSFMYNLHTESSDEDYFVVRTHLPLPPSPTAITNVSVRI
jgi:hypothetical protein